MRIIKRKASEPRASLCLSSRECLLRWIMLDPTEAPSDCRLNWRNCFFLFITKPSISEICKFDCRGSLLQAVLHVVFSLVLAFFCAALNQKFNASGSFCYFRLFSTIVCGLHGEKFCRQMMRASLKIHSEVLEINAISCSIKQFLCSSTQIQFSITKVFFLLQENCSAMTKKKLFSWIHKLKLIDGNLFTKKKQKCFFINSNAL